MALDLAVRPGRPGEGRLTETLAGIAYATQQARFDSAAQLLGVVQRLNDEIRHLDPGPRQRELKCFFAQPLIDALGAERHAREHALGATMSQDEAIDLARSL